MASSASTESSERSPLLPTQPTSDESFLSPPQAPRPSLATPASPSAMAKPSSEGRSKPSRSVSFNPNPVSRTIDASPPSSLPPTPPPAVPLFRNRGGLSTAPMSSAAFSASGRASYGATMTVGGGGGGGAGTSEGGGPPVLKALNSRLRRRNSYGSGPPMQFYPQPVPPKIGPQRSTKNAQKLKLLPNPEFGDDGPDEESGRDVYSQYTRIKDPTARRDAAILGKADRNRLPRVTAYCTANRYQMDGLMRFFKGRGRARGSNAKLIDECIYTPYSYHFGKTSQDSGGEDGGGSSYENAAYAAGNDQSSPEAAGHRDELPADNMQEASPAFFQERRHSADEVDADSFQRRRDDLIDLESGEGGDVGGNGHRGHHQRDEEAVADDEEDGRRHNDWDGVHRQGDDLEGFYDAEHREEQQQRQQESSHPRFSHQRQDAVSDVFEDMERGSSGNGGVHEHDGERQDRQQQLQQQEQQQQHQQQQEEQQKQQQQEQQQQQQQDEQQLQRLGEQPVDLDIHVHTPELFLFDYGVVVIWGMSEAQEQRFLKELAKFETEKLAPDDVEAEFFNFYYTREYQARIYNDFIALRDKNNYMTKLAISHALAQSVKTSLFEELIASTIDTCKDIPTQIALTGTIALSRSQINMQIGELFILRINIHLNGSVLDTPELFWVEPQLEPVYRAVRSYLEMDQRVGLLTQRLDVIADLLAVLKEQLSHGHGEMLEWIVIVLIAAEILVAAINIVVDLYAGGE